MSSGSSEPDQRKFTLDDLQIVSLRTASWHSTARRLRSEAALRQFVVRHAQSLFQTAVLAAEFPIRVDGNARIDALAIDAAPRPVVIEFKRLATGTAICRGLSYFDWLARHQGKFIELVMDRVSADAARRVDWSSPRVLCVAGQVGEREEAVARQVGRPIEFIGL
jgi:hypothetical protein